MFINSIECILAIGFGLFQINQAAKYNISVPFILERNCTHVVYKTTFEFFENPKPNPRYSIFDFLIIRTALETQLIHTGSFQYERDGRFHFDPYPRGTLYRYVTYRFEPQPDTWTDKFTVFYTFRFPDERNEYKLRISGDWFNGYGLIKSRILVGKQRCIPLAEITNCDPYCVCDTVAEKKCPDGSSLIGRCSFSGIITDSRGSYTFNESCPTTTTTTTTRETSTQTESSSNPSTSRSSSSTESVKKSFIGSQALESMMGLFLGGFVAVLAFIAFTFYGKKKRGLQLTNSDKSESKQTL